MPDPPSQRPQPTAPGIAAGAGAERTQSSTPPALAGSPPTPEQLVRFYDRSYAHAGERAQLYARWRALGAEGKADHVLKLCARAGVRAARVLDVGCGDGALLCELHRRGFGEQLDGVEIAQAAVRIAAARAEIDSVERYDGERLSAADASYDVGIVSHVLEHVPQPAVLLSEIARACAAVIVEVPLEDNLSARRAGKREHAHEVGHLQRLSRAGARAIVADAGLEVVAELDDPLPLAVQRFFATTPMARTAASAKWAVRAGMHSVAPALARRVFTVHYACLCTPRSRCVPRG